MHRITPRIVVFFCGEGEKKEKEGFSYEDKILQSKTRLSREDVLFIANEAKQHKNLASFVNWLKSVDELKEEFKIAT